MFAGVAAILLALISIPVANIGGFVIGFLFALLGGALSISWAPGESEAAAGPAPPAEAQPPKAVPPRAGAAPEYHDTDRAPRQPSLFKAALEVDSGRHRAG